MSCLAILGGDAAFGEGLPFVRVPAPPLERVVERLRPSYEAGMLTNGRLVRELEELAAERLGVAHVVAVSSCTAGLMLALRSLELDRPVLVPSFTFSAGPHAVSWNGLRPRFAECDPESFQLDCEDAAGRADGIGAVMATHIYGAPCDAEAVEALAARCGVPALFDAAHGFGARRGSRPVGGFGSAEVFSLSPTKPVVAGEGGLVATDVDHVAESVRIGRDYANPGDYDTRFVGLNARLSELHAAVALESVAQLDEHAARRDELARRYLAGIASIPGLSTQRIDPGDVSTWKDFTIAVDPARFGADRDDLAAALRADGIDTRRYFDPPVHLQRSHARRDAPALPVTEAVARRVLSLPLYPALGDDDVDRIVEVLATVHDHAEAVAAAAGVRGAPVAGS